MKKIVCLILLMALLMNVSALAEEFTLHSGVTFGMKESEVIACEEKAGFKVAKYTTKYGESYYDELHKKFYDKCISAKGTFVNKEGEILYFFDENGCLYQCMYWWKADSLDDSHYVAVEEGLTTKYGITKYMSALNRPLNIPVDSLTAITEKSAENVRPSSKTMTINYQVPIYSHRIIDNGENNLIVIDHSLIDDSLVFSFGDGTSSRTTEYHEKVIYTRLDAIQEKALRESIAQEFDDL